MNWFNPTITYQILLIVQAIHLLHHRFAKRDISYAEGISALVLCIQPAWNPIGYFLSIAHVVFIVVQIAGSVWIKKLSPDWKRELR